MPLRLQTQSRKQDCTQVNGACELTLNLRQGLNPWAMREQRTHAHLWKA